MRLPPTLVLAVALLAISWAAILIRLAEAPTAVVAFYRLSVATLAIAPTLAWRTPSLPRPAGRVLGLSVLSGLLLAGHFATWIASLHLTSISSSVLLVTTQPMFALVLGRVFLGEGAGRLGLIGVGLTLLGSALLVGAEAGGGGDALAGNLLALTGALLAALYLLIGRHLREALSFRLYLVAVYGSAAFWLLLLVGVTGGELAPYPAATYAAMVALGLGPNVIGHSGLNWAVRHMKTYVVNVALLVEPLLTTLYGIWLFDEWPSAAFVPAATAILLGLVLVFRDTTGERPTTGAQAVASSQLE